MKRNKKHQCQGQQIILAKSEFTEQWEHKKLTPISCLWNKYVEKNKVRRIELLFFNQQLLEQTNIWKSMQKENIWFGNTEFNDQTD